MNWVRMTIGSGLCLFLLSGCLVTRDQIRETTARPSESSSTPQVTPAQVTKAAQAARVDELEESLRQAMGRVEVLENQLSQMQASQQTDQTKATQGAEVQQKLQAYEEALRSLESQVQTLQTELSKAQTAKPSPTSKSDSSTDKGEKSGNFANAEEAFNSKDWKKAIVGYQKYRDLNPKGKWYSEATYKIGVSFQELGMNSEAKAFYDEVIAKFPNGKMAEKAKYRLKSLK